tara:strand:- start:336 stop:1289 length:954 start_codon:yes stop_codon:yes gene_type:complete
MQAVTVQKDLPRNRPTQFEAWTETDGQIVHPMPDGDYLKVNTHGRTHTANEACFDVWNAVNREAQMLSAAGFTLTDVVGKDLVGACLDAINRVFALATSRVVTHANRLYSSTFGGPVPYQYMTIPIRWTGESPEALKYVMKFVETLYQIPQVRSNTIDNGLPSEHASIILQPLFALKADIMKHRFQLEVKGNVSPQELDALFRGSNLMPPLGSSFDDRRDSVADLAVEDATALANESAQTPTLEISEQIRGGVDVWTWVPSNQNWDTFAELNRRFEVDGPSQPLFTPFPFSNEQIGSQAAGSPGAGTVAGGGLVTPT